VFQVFTNDPPAIKILDGRAYIYLNVTFSLFEEQPAEVSGIYFDEIPVIDQPDSNPVLQIEVVSEAEVFAQMQDRKLDVELNLHNSRASLIQSKISGLSQKAVDLIMSMAIPFLENATEIFLGHGVEMDKLIRIPSQNESMRLEAGFVRFAADTNVRNLL
jgi:hypothetical protein